jgi:hypothetical protein
VLEVDAATAPDPDLLAAPAAAPAFRAMAPAPDVPAPPPPRPPRESFGRRVRGVLLLFLPLVLILGVAIGGVGWYARRSYYVGFAADRVVIYKGVPGGVLGWNPTIERRTALTSKQLTEIDRLRVAGGAARGSLSDAEDFVANVRANVAATSTTTTTTTTKPRVTTTTRPRGPTTTRPRKTVTTKPRATP